MSEQEKESGVAATGSIVSFEQTAGSRHKQPYRPTELQEEPTTDLHHKRSRVPAAPILAEELKVSTIHQDLEEQRECDRAMSSEKHKQSETEIRLSNTKRRESSPETMALTTLEVETKKRTLTVPPQPIPVETVISTIKNLVDEKNRGTDLVTKSDDDSLTEDVAELRITDSIGKRAEWSDDEEAGGLPRSDSRSFRVSRAMRQLFCCGMLYEAPSEDNVSSAQDYIDKKSGPDNNDGLLDNPKHRHQDKMTKEYLATECAKLNIGAKSQYWLLEGKASIGPCFHPGLPREDRSGIMICVPKKSMRKVKEDFNVIPSVINISVSKKCIAAKSKSQIK
ncbi:uncharacterized protein LOC131847927 [Achroia grisella]|uniref:uncharacterized protein LOC131847927 n=1 Tax=Achroia grisella TaxID=688607 RepID=UPI0027D2507D|nr:uncharacterized protein LOC131847927 [Achroia grisella]